MIWSMKTHTLAGAVDGFFTGFFSSAGSSPLFDSTVGFFDSTVFFSGAATVFLDGVVVEDVVDFLGADDVDAEVVEVVDFLGASLVASLTAGFFTGASAFFPSALSFTAGAFLIGGFASLEEVVGLFTGASDFFTKRKGTMNHRRDLRENIDVE